MERNCRHPQREHRKGKRTGLSITSPKLRNDERKISPPHLLQGVSWLAFGFLAGRGLAGAAFAPEVLTVEAFTVAALAAGAPPAVVLPEETLPAPVPSVLFVVMTA